MPRLTSIILASSSAIRRKLLRQAGWRFRIVLPSPAAEPAPVPGERAARYALRAACAKALDVSRRRPRALVIGADQVVEFDGRILRKASGSAQARARLRTFSGRRHDLVGGWCLCREGRILHKGLSRVRVYCHDLGRAEIAAYLKAEKPYSSVACYYLEGRGIRLVKRLEGCLFSALGLPLLPIQAALRELERAARECP